MSIDVTAQIAAELNLPARGVAAVVALLADRNTVPFIARYRKEATGGLDEVQIRSIEERRAYLAELEARKATIASAIEQQGALTAELAARIAACRTKAELEDLYLPYKKKRRTRAAKARERGLAPLAERILAQPDAGDPRAEADAFVAPDREVPDADAALAGARDIVAEAIAERADVRAHVRRAMMESGRIECAATADAAGKRTKFEQYYDHTEPVKSIPSHRYLAIRRGERENVLRARVVVDDAPLVAWIERAAGLRPASPFAPLLADAVRDAYRRLIAPSVETDVRVDLKLRADEAAVEVFGANLRNLLLAPPLGPKPVIGIDPGIRTGCKCAAVDATGRFVAHTTIFLARGDTTAAERTLIDLVRAHRPAAIAVGNGTGGREAEAFVRRALRDHGIDGVIVVPVNEAGASVYSASDVAREEFPDLDVTVRGAISIARRLQDPLAELVKIEPKAIGVGQYQHDVHQPLLARKLAAVVESCVNHVGVELNTASASLLAYVAGIGPALAKKIVAHRDARGPFASRAELLDVPGVGPRAFEQAAGFLRIRGGSHPLDASAVHPERYPIVERMAADLGVGVDELVGNAELARRIDIGRYAGGDVGEPTLRDIVAELSKPGRDPRAEFEPPRFRDDVNDLADLREGMQLEGVVTNVTAFGAFVDIGVHQDGLVHVSQLADRFVKDPAEVVKVGDKLRVRVLSVDLERRRIALSARRGDAPARGDKRGGGRPNRPAQPRRERRTFSNNPFAVLADRDKPD
ncbi:MAG: RNA-binding transcriptional accessory protein [Deltaproteobacteria bacterium]|nr:MAG: RNA-binding transcriptional accessory protein [Deltaproteobacteria bacterium]